MKRYDKFEDHYLGVWDLPVGTTLGEANAAAAAPAAVPALAALSGSGNTLPLPRPGGADDSSQISTAFDLLLQANA